MTPEIAKANEGGTLFSGLIGRSGGAAGHPAQ